MDKPPLPGLEECSPTGGLRHRLIYGLPPGLAGEDAVSMATFLFKPLQPRLARVPRAQRVILITSASTRGEIEPVEVHYLGPSRHEVGDEFLLRVGTGIYFREGAQN